MNHPLDASMIAIDQPRFVATAVLCADKKAKTSDTIPQADFGDGH